jgi:hypothetical protein
LTENLLFFCQNSLKVKNYCLIVLWTKYRHVIILFQIYLKRIFQFRRIMIMFRAHCEQSILIRTHVALLQLNRAVDSVN